MNAADFYGELLAGLSALTYPVTVEVGIDVTVVKGRVRLPDGRFLQVFYNEVTGTTALALVDKGARLWGIDFDNIRGWHEHPVVNPDSHIAVKPMSPREVLSLASEAYAAAKPRLGT